MMTPFAAQRPFRVSRDSARRTVDQYEVVFVVHTAESSRFRRVSRCSSSTSSIFRARQVTVGRQDVVPAFGRRAPAPRRARQADQDLVHGFGEAALVDPAAHGGIALRVEIDQQHALPLAGQRGRQIHAGRGLADPALLVCDANMRAMLVLNPAR
jgi:hypothetical protein